MSIYPKSMFFTSESVTEGHPDKFCDQISDAVLDECLKRDPMSRVACNTYVTMGLLLVGTGRRLSAYRRLVGAWESSTAAS